MFSLCGACGIQDCKFPPLSCSHSLCGDCISSKIEKMMRGEEVEEEFYCLLPECSAVLLPDQIQKRISNHLFSAYLDHCLQRFMGMDEEVSLCPNEDCSMACSIATWTTNEILKLEVNTITQNNEDGSPLDRPSWIHFNQFRIRCYHCHQDYCSKCNISPYHLGMDCKQYSMYSSAKKCRFCQEAITQANCAPFSSIPALQSCCSNEDCIESLQMVCNQIHECGHECGGIREEKCCLPCLQCPLDKEANRKENVPLLAQNSQDYCPICWVEDLSAKPSIQLACGHIVHMKCVSHILDLRWTTEHIHFSFLSCPLCHEEIEHVALSEMKEVILELKRKVIDVGEKVLKEENNMTDSCILNDPSSEYYENIEKYVLDKFTFYQCHKCDAPFYGGRMNCGVGEREEGVQSSDFVCPGCRSEKKRIDCQNVEHEQFWVYKCKYCCSPAKWFCFGNTHFCTSCHDDASRLRYVSAEELEQCRGPPFCPLGIEHPPHGENFILNCQLCQESMERDPEESKRLATWEKRQKWISTSQRALIFFFHLLAITTFTVSLIYNIPEEIIMYGALLVLWEVFAVLIILLLKVNEFRCLCLIFGPILIVTSYYSFTNVAFIGKAIIYLTRFTMTLAALLAIRRRKIYLIMTTVCVIFCFEACNWLLNFPFIPFFGMMKDSFVLFKIMYYGSVMFLLFQTKNESSIIIIWNVVFYFFQGQAPPFLSLAVTFIDVLYFTRYWMLTLYIFLSLLIFQRKIRPQSVNKVLCFGVTSFGYFFMEVVCFYQDLPWSAIFSYLPPIVEHIDRCIFYC